MPEDGYKLDFIGIGVYKAGTSSVSNILETHPQICFSIPKEIRYFNKFHRSGQLNENHSRDQDWYFKHYGHCEKGNIRGEFSPGYFIDPGAPKKIHKLFPEIKLIICLRNPIDRAYSDYQMRRHYSLQETKSFSNAIRESSVYVENGLYFKHLKRYLDYFEMENIFIITLEDLKENLNHTIKSLFHFLNVDESFMPDLSLSKSNYALKSKLNFIRVAEFKMKRFFSRNGGGEFLLWLKRHKIHLLLQKIYSSSYKYPPMEDKDRQWLSEQFAADITELESFLQRDLSSWK
jgi:hypothetical protein